MVLSNTTGASSAARFPWLRPSWTYGTGAAGSTERPQLGRPLGTHFGVHALPRTSLRLRSVMPSVESVLLALGNLDSDDEDLPPTKVARVPMLLLQVATLEKVERKTEAIEVAALFD